MDVRQLFKNLKKEAECPLCLETFHKPKTLPCLHSFCLLCLDKHAGYARRQLQTTIKCPVCLTCFEIPEGDTFGCFPTSFHLNRLVDVLALGDDNPQSQTCSSCEETENNTATCYCFDCSDFFCGACAKVHNQMKISRHHRNVAIKELKAQDVEELIHRPVMCGEKYHEKEALEYHCQECKVCICHKCVILNHNRHTMVDIQEAAEEQKMQITEVLEQAKTKIVHFELQMTQETELLNKSKEETQAARTKVRTTIEELIRVLKEHEMAMVAKLDDVDEERQKCHSIQQERAHLLVTQLRTSVEFCEAVLQRNLSFEIMQTEQTLVKRCKTLLNEERVNVKKPSHVSYVTNEKNLEDKRSAVPGRVIVSYTDPSQSVVGLLIGLEGNGLKEAEVDEDAGFLITTKDSEGQQCCYENDHLEITIKTPSGELVKPCIIEELNFMEDGEEVDGGCGCYYVTYTPHCANEHTVVITMNGQPLTGSPWRVQVSPHQYKSVLRFGSFGHGVQGIAFSEVSNIIAIADFNNYRVILFSSNGAFVKEFVFQQHEGKPTSVAFTRSGNIIVVHARRISLFTEKLQFIERITNENVKRPYKLSVACDGQIIVTDSEDNAIKVLSPDGKKMLLSFSAPDCHSCPWSAAVHYQDMFFVSYRWAHCIKVFDKEGVFLYDIGSEGSGDGQLSPGGLAIDKFNNLIVCDTNNSRLQVFTLDGTFVNSKLTGPSNPCWIAASNRGHVFVAYDNRKAHVGVFR